jgi:hypothetical protein
MLDFLVRIFGIGLAVGFGVWSVLKVWDLIRDYRIDNGHGGLANDGDDWSPFPSVKAEEPKRPDIEQQVCQDILRRQKLGIAKYGRTLADNPLSLRAWLKHAYEECLDQAAYLRRAMAEMDEQERLDRDK